MSLLPGIVFTVAYSAENLRIYNAEIIMNKVIQYKHAIIHAQLTHIVLVVHFL